MISVVCWPALTVLGRIVLYHEKTRNQEKFEKKLTFLNDEKNIKKNQFIQKEDSLGVYLLTVRDILHRNQVAPKSYVIPTIRQMILHKRKLELMNSIEKTIIVDAIKNKKFEQY